MKPKQQQNLIGNIKLTPFYPVTSGNSLFLKKNIINCLGYVYGK